MHRRILVIGATRILRPAALRLADEGWEIVAMARTPEDLHRLAAERPGGIVALQGDHRRLKVLRTLLKTAGRVDAALVYAPVAGPRTLALLRSAVGGPVVQLVTSAAAAPDAVLPPVPAQPWYQVILGWRADGTWHSPAEVSDAALTALAEERDLVLGAVRPWADRPR